MSYYDFTKQYGATQKAKFWCDYMAGLRGQLQALDTPRAPSQASIWSRVNTNEVLLYDVLYGDYFRAAGQSVSHRNDFLIAWCEIMRVWYKETKG